MDDGSFFVGQHSVTRKRPKILATADVILIREALKALVEVVLPVGRITFGGHPAITPLITFFVEGFNLGNEHFTLYQSELFRPAFPEEVSAYSDVRVVESVQGDRAKSLLALREAMISSRRFDAGVFIGGMEGIIDEAAMFRALHPESKFMPIASTGAAAEYLFNAEVMPAELKTDLTYSTLFRRHLLRSSR